MKKFKEYVTETFGNTGYRLLSLHEELDAAQKKIVDGWGEGAARKLSSHVFPEGQDRISIPVEHPQAEVEAHPAVREHLEKHGYQVSDYRAGFATDKYGRQVSIGKVLNKTKAEPHVTHAFNTDPNRKAQKHDNESQTKIIISRHPHDVAGMSTNRSWNSCMTMPGDKNNPQGGCYNHILRNDIAKGTHVAYLVHKDDDDIKKPLARIALKPFHPEGGGKTILRPEDATYPHEFEQTAFSHSVRKWAEKNFPADEDKSYEKDSDVYHDSGSRRITSFKSMFNSNDPYERASAFRDHSDKITPAHIEKGLADPSGEVRAAAIKHPLLKPEQIDKVMSDKSRGNAYYRAAAVQNVNVAPHHITDALNDPEYTVRNAAASSPKANSEHLHKALDDPDDVVKTNALLNKNIKPEHLLKVLETGSRNMRETAATHVNATPAVLDKALDPEQHDWVRQNAAANENASSANIHKALQDKDAGVRTYAIANRKAKPEHIDLALNMHNTHPGVAEEAAKHPNATSDQIHKALDTDNVEVQQAAMRNPNAKPEHLLRGVALGGTVAGQALKHPNVNAEVVDAAMKSDNVSLRRAALRSPHITKEHLTAALDNPELAPVAAVHPKIDSDHLHQMVQNPDLQHTTMSHKLFGSQHIDTAMKSESSDVRSVAMMSKHATPEQLRHHFNNDSSSSVRAAIVSHEKVPDDVVDKAMTDSSADVRNAVVNNPNLKKHHLDTLSNSNDPDVQFKVAMHPKATKGQLNNIMNNGDERARSRVLLHPNVSPSTVKVAAKDDSPTVRATALSHRYAAKEDQINALGDESKEVKSKINSFNLSNEDTLKAMDHENPAVRYGAINHWTAGSQHVEKGMKDPDTNVRVSALMHDRATSQHVEAAHNDPEPMVRAVAAFHKLAKPENILKASYDEDSSVRSGSLISNRLPKKRVQELADSDPDEGVKKFASTVLKRNGHAD